MTTQDPRAALAAEKEIPNVVERRKDFLKGWAACAAIREQVSGQTPTCVICGGAHYTHHCDTPSTAKQPPPRERPEGEKPWPPRKIVEECRDEAQDLFHLWARFPEYEPLSEDLAINLVSAIRDSLIQRWRQDQAALQSAVSEARAKAFEEVREWAEMCREQGHDIAKVGWSGVEGIWEAQRDIARPSQGPEGSAE